MLSSEILIFICRLAQKQLETLKIKLKESLDKEKLLSKVTEQANKLRNATQDEKDILSRLEDRENERLKLIKPMDKNAKQENETQREYLIRTGKVTPFSNLPQETHQTKLYDTNATSNTVFPGSGHMMSHQHLHAPQHQITNNKRKVPSSDEEDDEYKDEEEEEEEESTLLDSDDEFDLSDKKKRSVKKLDEIYDDDGSETNYQKRLNDWIQQRQIMRNQVTHVSKMHKIMKKKTNRLNRVTMIPRKKYLKHIQTLKILNLIMA